MMDIKADVEMQALILQKLDALEKAIMSMAVERNAHLSRKDIMQRLGLSSTTLRVRLEKDREFPRPTKGGKFLLSDIIAWEQRKSNRL